MTKKVDILETPRLILKGISKRDAPDIVKWRSNPVVYKYFKHPHKLSLSEHLNWYYNFYKKDLNRLDWIARDKKTNTKCGVFGIILRNDIVEVNYLLAPEAQHNGLASEALKVLIPYIGSLYKRTKIIAEIHKDNLASVNLIKKLGFTQEKVKGDFYTYSLNQEV